MFLEISNLTKSFGGLKVLCDVSFTLEKGEILGLIGPNGAGKSTLFNLITGVYRPNKGEIRFQGKSLAGLKPHRICRRGIARTFQLVRIFPSMTVLENVLTGVLYGRSGAKRKAMDEALECLEILNLSALKDTVAAHLTYSDRRLVELARAIAAQPGLALLDEPLAGLNPAETEAIMAVIQNIRAVRGISIIWIEHKMDAVFNVCDRIVVLDYGVMIAEGRPREIATNKKVVEAYLGEPLA
ncbi:MAG: ABC transporter ATP-binding protein [Desulfobacterales bacterium]|nr:MAG: ABC transporter ATP-binding protein [Desulfobacterales bacterium]